MIFDAASRHRSGVLSLEAFRNRILGDNARQGPECASEDGATVFSHMRTLPTLTQACQQLIGEAMTRANGNQSIASRLLGISQPALSRRLSHANAVSQKSCTPK
jgi:DNA-binding NtrC family response regulator